jgi:hypothetical protein
MDMHLLSGEQCIGTKLHKPAHITSLRKSYLCLMTSIYTCSWVGIICVAVGGVPYILYHILDNFCVV